MLNNFWNQFIIFFLGVLLVEYAILLLAQTNAAEAVSNILEALHAIRTIVAIECFDTEA